MATDVLDLSIKMTHDGVLLTAKSSIIENYFKSFGDLNTHKWQNLEAYKLDSKIAENYRLLGMLNAWGINTPYYDGYRLEPNLAFLRVKGLSKGIKVVYKYPLSKQARKDLLNRISAFTKILYEDYIKNFHKRRYEFLCTYCEKFVKTRKFTYLDQTFCEICAKKFQIKVDDN